jgi:hypothetical protein
MFDFLHFFLHPKLQVEHVIREEKMMSAYELIEIYCELIVARLPIIEAQKYVVAKVLKYLFERYNWFL